MMRIALSILRMTGRIGCRFCWLIVCLYLASGVVSYARRWPAKVVAVVPRLDGIRVVTEGGRRGRPGEEDRATLALGALAWAGLFWVKGTSRWWSGLVALGVLGAVGGAMEPMRRWRLAEQLAAVQIGRAHV